MPSNSPTGKPANSSPTPTLAPSSSKSSDPTVSPGSNPTMSPNASPTYSPTLSPVSDPTASPNASPTLSPVSNPISSPSSSPTSPPTVSPVLSSSSSPTASPTFSPTLSPVSGPTSSPNASPTLSPVSSPTSSPSSSPTSSPTLSPISDLTFPPTRYCLPNAAKVKLSSTTGQHLQMFEFQVFSSGVNIALGKTAGQSSTYGRLFAPLAIDGSLTTFSHTNDNNAWWEVDLAGLSPLESISIANRWCSDPSDPNGCLCRLSNASIELIDDIGTVVVQHFLADTCNEHQVNVDLSSVTFCSASP
ncbi:hypothetical protein ACHAWX_002153 [Stephanocyclus meneghinianus]